MISSKQNKASQASRENAIVPAPSEKSSEPERVRDLEERVEKESRARKKAEAETEEMREKVAPLERNVVVSLGKVGDMGKRAGAILPALRELRALSKRDRDSLSADEKKRLLDLQRQNAEVLGMLPEIAGFQDNPSEYGGFFRGLVQQAAGLTDAQAAQVESYMTRRAEEMNQFGLNTSKQPSDPARADPWEEKRDAFNGQTAEGLRDLLPAGAADQAGINAQLMELLEMDFDKAEANAGDKN